MGEDTPASSCSEAAAPPSPGVSPVNLSDALEELLRFTLSAFVEDGEVDGRDLGISRDYCSRLLRDEPAAFDPHLTGFENDCGGVPVYPLYKNLARAIERCINSGSFMSQASSAVSVPVDEKIKMKESDWSKLIMDDGMQLANMFKAVDFELHVQEPFFSQLRAGLKTVEGRCAVGNYNRITPGSLILFNKCLLLDVQHVHHYSSFSKMLQVETLAKVLPGVHTIEDGVQVYHKFYTEEKEISNGVLAISVSRPASQPFSFLTKLLCGLSYDGIARLLGIMHTASTVPDALPPPRSFLIFSSMEPSQPNDVKGCSLTAAARALAKHVNRSSNGWWGDFFGNDSKKNKLALEVINRLLSECCWMNVHLIQPYQFVFEIRVPDGFGARWSKDGSKFIGFLEPYSEEGFSKGWKH